MKFPIGIFCFLFAFLSFATFAKGDSTPAAGATATVQVGGQSIVIPYPQGFVRGDGIDANWDNTFQSMLPVTNRLVAAFRTEQDIAGLKSGTPPQSNRSFNIQIVRNIENQEIGETTFAQMRGDMKTGLDEMRAKMDSEVKAALDSGKKKLGIVDKALEISDSAVLGFFEDTPSSLGFTMAAKVQGNAGGKSQSSKFVVAALMVPVNGRLLNLYANSGYETEADRQWAESQVKVWRDAVVAANPRVKGKAYSFGFDWNRVLTAGMIGGIVGAIVGLFKWFGSKKKA